MSFLNTMMTQAPLRYQELVADLKKQPPSVQGVYEVSYSPTITLALNLTPPLTLTLVARPAAPLPLTRQMTCRSTWTRRFPIGSHPTSTIRFAAGERPSTRRGNLRNPTLTPRPNPDLDASPRSSLARSFHPSRAQRRAWNACWRK